MDAIRILPSQSRATVRWMVAFVMDLRCPPSDKAGGMLNVQGGMQMKSTGGQYSNRPTYSPRPERNPAIRAQWEHNKKIILARESICGICGKPVDKSLRYPDPMSPTVDHIIPVSKRGDPVALENLQLAHRYCNRMKSDKLPNKNEVEPGQKEKIFFEQSANWRTD